MFVLSFLRLLRIRAFHLLISLPALLNLWIVGLFIDHFLEAVGHVL